MRRFMILLSMFVLGMGVIASAAVARPASPHFISASAARDGADLVVSFKIAGLGSFATVAVATTATITRTDACVNGGGNVPTDAKKKTTSGTITTSDRFPVENGQVTGTLTLTPPASTLKCPGGQTATLQSLSYSSVSVSGAEITQQIPSTF
jgi:hypothetical protein